MINTHNVRITFGKHGPAPGRPGELFTRLPISYLKWMVSEKCKQCELAEAELERRGVVELDVELSDHAIDRAVHRCHITFIQDRADNEGLTNWLRRMTLEALHNGNDDRTDNYVYKGMKLVIKTDGAVPYLVSIMKRGK